MMHTLNSLTLSLLIAISLTVTAHAQDTADTLLDRIEAKSDTIQTYQADIRFDQIQGLLGDQQTRFGKLYYVVKPHVKFAVHFQRVVIDGKLREQNRQWIYDGTWLVEKLEDKKQFFKRQVHPPPPGSPGSPGSPGISKTSDHTNALAHPENHNDPMSLENNPFPIPLQAKKSQVLKRFTALLVTDKSEDDPKDIETYHLKLTPKPNLGITFTQIDLWYDKATLLPIKCYTVNADSDDEQIFSLFNPKLNEPIDKKDMDTSAPTDRGWQIEVTPLKN